MRAPKNRMIESRNISQICIFLVSLKAPLIHYWLKKINKLESNKSQKKFNKA